MAVRHGLDLPSRPGAAGAVMGAAGDPPAAGAFGRRAPGRVARQVAGVAAGVGVCAALWFAARVLDRDHAAELFDTGMAVLVVVALVSALATRHVLSDLRRLRLIAVFLPGASVVAIELIFYALRSTGRVDEVTTHAVTTSVFGLGAVVLPVYLVRTFSGLGEQLNQRAHRLRALHTWSTRLACERDVAVLLERIPRYGRLLADADGCTLAAGPPDGPPGSGCPDPPDGLPGCGCPDPPEDAPGPDHDRSLAVPLPVTTDPPLTLTLTRRTPFDDQERLLLQMYAVAAAAATDSARHLQDAQMVATLEERARVARDLHDELGQLLAYLTTMVQAIEELVARGDTDRARQELSRLETASRALGLQVREAILGLRAQVPPGGSLEGTLRAFVADFGALSGLATSLDCAPRALSGLPAVVQYHVLQIVKEAMSNARQHARGTRVEVRAQRHDAVLEISVRDDGRGVASGPGAGFGLKTMVERARTLGGSLDLRSSPGRGTVVTLRVPEPEGAGDAGAAGR